MVLYYNQEGEKEFGGISGIINRYPIQDGIMKLKKLPRTKKARTKQELPLK